MSNSVISTLKIKDIEYDLGLKTLDNIEAGVLPIDKGGTGATTAEGACENLNAASEDIIIISDTQPTSSKCLLWVEI